ncbi:NAD-dependent epimerase/dehydratase family protein [Candidatus Acetothermia bacterium]|jgi:nucleoside-diphosphate-sugar epimerase|nr:NAD-dependent epimerase/dehydratase family protein [Candidatus Acetothermia bacterium]MCI2432154.1 NAD-dependent epimerase/dehydratase family protein [Candidatus Acetothermia bacterium]MCI2436153.1 NAD-dependent epimerase/dehydratase family protein [Candidatus Acetothermia bacterium]
MKVLILGGTGLTGPFTTRYLVDQGHQVTVFHRGQHSADLPSTVNRLLGERRELNRFAGEFKRLAPEVVLDMLAATRDDAEMLLRVFRGVAQRVVVPSSIDVYRVYGRLHGTEPGPVEPIPLAEEAPLREKLSIHGEAYEKRWVEQVVLSDPQLPGTVLRYPMIYGPNDGGRTFHLVKRMMDQRPVILIDEGLARWRWSRGYAENVAWATVLAVTQARARNRIYNVAEPEGLSYLEWVQRVTRAAGWPGRIVVVPRDRLKVQGHHEHHWVVDTTRIRAELGYMEVVPQEAALRRTVDWQRANPLAEYDSKDFDYDTEDTILAELEQTDRR